MSSKLVAARRSFLALVATVALIAGCASAGTQFDLSKVDQLKPGVSTLAEATQLLGKPYSTSTDGKGQQLVQWMYVTTGFAGSSVQSDAAAVLFDKDGVMVRLIQKRQSGK